MSFLLKIYFIGMIAFVPSGEGEDMMVLMQNVGEATAASDGSTIHSHLPLLLARADSCLGPCRESFGDAAQHLLQGAEGVPRGQETAHLESAIDGGAVLRMNGADWTIETSLPGAQGPGSGLSLTGSLSRDLLRGGTFFPKTAEESSDFGWVASVNEHVPGLVIDPQLLQDNPGSDRVIGRMLLDRGTLSTHGLVHHSGKIAPLSFRRLGVASQESDTGAPLADSAVAEIQITGCEVYLRERRFDGEEGRLIRLAPDSCTGDEVVEIAWVNLPARGSHVMEADTVPVGAHFELYYDLAAQSPDSSQRPVPHLLASAEEGLFPSRRRSSPEDLDLLERLVLGPIRGGYSSSICPLSQYP